MLKHCLFVSANETLTMIQFTLTNQGALDVYEVRHSAQDHLLGCEVTWDVRKCGRSDRGKIEKAGALFHVPPGNY